MGRLLDSHSPFTRACMGEKMGRRGRKTPWLRRYCYSNEAGSRMKPPWPEVCVGLRLSPSTLQSRLASCKCLFIFERRKKKGLSSTKGKKIDLMEGIKGVKLHWCLESCKLSLEENARGAEWGEIIVMENVSVVWAVILLTKIVTAAYIHETL